MMCFVYRHHEISHPDQSTVAVSNTQSQQQTPSRLNRGGVRSRSSSQNNVQFSRVSSAAASMDDLISEHDTTTGTVVHDVDEEGEQDESGGTESRDADEYV